MTATSSHLFRCPACDCGYAAPHHRNGVAYCPVCLYRLGRPLPSRRKLSRAQRLAARDGATCHLCGEPVNFAEAGDLRASVDHVVPLARGGADVMGNLRLAHAICNSMRGDGPVRNPWVETIL